MFMYFPVPSIRKDSAKLQHYLALCDFYLECRSHEQLRRFTIEPRVTEKGGPEPDIFMIWKSTPFYVELQRNIFSQKVMESKLQRYEEFYDSGEWKRFDWQPSNKPIFPRVWILTPSTYLIDITVSFPVIQTTNASELVKRLKPQ